MGGWVGSSGSETERCQIPLGLGDFYKALSSLAKRYAPQAEFNSVGFIGRWLVMNSVSTTEAHYKKRRFANQDFTLVYFLLGAFFLFITVCGRILPRSLRPFASMTNRSDTVWQEARKAVHVVMGYAFMR